MSTRDRITQVRRLADVAAVRDRLAELDLETGTDLCLDDDLEVGPDAPLARPWTVALAGSTVRTVGNRFAVLPMEGWDGTTDGRPTDLVARRWERFGAGGAKLVWGGEAVAVRVDGRANPNQLCIGPSSVDDLGGLRSRLVAAHAGRHGRTDDLVVGLQLTHSGRWSRPDGSPVPRIAYRHPVLDGWVPLDESSVLSDGELDDLMGDFVVAAEVAAEAGFDFVDVKACHGYLLHELLSGVDRDGSYGGALEDRARFQLGTLAAIRAAVPDLGLGVRLSLYDLAPHEAGPDGVGRPAVEAPYRFAFGGDGTGTGLDLSEPDRLLGMLADAGVSMVCATAGSPYHCPHAQRPAYFPPSDGYLPPADPLVEVARLIGATAALRARHPELAFVGSGYSYLQEWLAHVAQAEVRAGRVDAVGLGRMVLSYPDLPSDVLAGRPLDRRRLCRTFSDCTTAPRNGLVSGCFPLDEHYKAMEARVELTRVKREAEVARGGRRR